MYGYIYLTTNLITNKKYIGQHKSENFDYSYKGSGKILTRSINKYGFDNFKCELLEECFSKEELDSKEKYYISLYDAVESSDFYNLTAGGSGGSQPGLIVINKDGHCKRIIKEDLQKYLDLGYSLGGLSQSKEVVQNRVAKLRGLQRTSEQRKNISNSLKGKKPSRKTIENSIKSRKENNFIPFVAGKKSMYSPDLDKVIFISENQIEDYIQLGYIVGRRPCSKESSIKKSVAQKQLICMTNDLKTIKVKECEIQKYLEQGYHLGRIPTRPNQKQENRKFMYKDNEQHMVKEADWDLYLKNGYQFGRLR